MQDASISDEPSSEELGEEEYLVDCSLQHANKVRVARKVSNILIRTHNQRDVLRQFFLPFIYEVTNEEILLYHRHSSGDNKLCHIYYVPNERSSTGRRCRRPDAARRYGRDRGRSV